MAPRARGRRNSAWQAEQQDRHPRGGTSSRCVRPQRRQVTRDPPGASLTRDHCWVNMSTALHGPERPQKSNRPSRQGYERILHTLTPHPRSTAGLGPGAEPLSRRVHRELPIHPTPYSLDQLEKLLPRTDSIPSRDRRRTNRPASGASGGNLPRDVCLFKPEWVKKSPSRGLFSGFSEVGNRTAGVGQRKPVF